MNVEICQSVLDHRAQLVPTIFTERQVNLVQKYLSHQKFTPSEQAYFYSAIRRKVEALSSLKEEYHVTGTEMIPERVEQAKQILKELGHEKAFISGSFLYKKEYRDIDVFILTKKRNSYHRGNLHLNFITSKVLKHPIYISSLHYSVATFSPQALIAKWNRPTFDSIIMTYELAINEVLNREEERTLRELLFMHHFFVKKIVLDSYELSKQSEDIINMNNSEKISLINQLMKELILKIFAKRYLYLYLGTFVKGLKKTYSQEPYDNFPIFINLFTEVKNECRA